MVFVPLIPSNHPPQMKLSVLTSEKKDMLSFHGSENLLFISKMQQAACVFISPNANEHPERIGFPINYVWHSSNISRYRIGLPGSNCKIVPIWFLNESQNVLDLTLSFWWSIQDVLRCSTLTLKSPSRPNCVLLLVHLKVWVWSLTRRVYKQDITNSLEADPGPVFNKHKAWRGNLTSSVDMHWEGGDILCQYSGIFNEMGKDDKNTQQRSLHIGSAFMDVWKESLSFTSNASRKMITL